MKRADAFDRAFLRRELGIGYGSSSQLGDATIRRLKSTVEYAGHRASVCTSNWSADGLLLATAGEDSTVKLWDVGRPASSACIASFDSGHTSGITCARFMPGSTSKLATCGGDRQVRIMDLERQAIKPFMSHKARVKCLAMIDADVFLSAGEDGTVRRVDVRERPPSIRQMRDLEEYNSRNVLVEQRIERHGRATVRIGVNAISVNPQATNSFATGSADPFVRVFDMRMLRPPGAPGAAPPANLNVFVPSHLVAAAAAPVRACHVTGVAFSASGRDVLASYSHENMYSFSTRQHAQDYDTVIRSVRNGASRTTDTQARGRGAPSMHSSASRLVTTAAASGPAAVVHAGGLSLRPAGGLPGPGAPQSTHPPHASRPGWAQVSPGTPAGLLTHTPSAPAAASVSAEPGAAASPAAGRHVVTRSAAVQPPPPLQIPTESPGAGGGALSNSGNAPTTAAAAAEQPWSPLGSASEQVRAGLERLRASRLRLQSLMSQPFRARSTSAAGQPSSHTPAAGTSSTGTAAPAIPPGQQQAGPSAPFPLRQLFFGRQGSGASQVEAPAVQAGSPAGAAAGSSGAQGEEGEEGEEGAARSPAPKRRRLNDGRGVDASPAAGAGYAPAAAAGAGGASVAAGFGAAAVGQPSPALAAAAAAGAGAGAGWAVATAAGVLAGVSLDVLRAQVLVLRQQVAEAEAQVQETQQLLSAAQAAAEGAQLLQDGGHAGASHVLVEAVSVQARAHAARVRAFAMLASANETLGQALDSLAHAEQGAGSGAAAPATAPAPQASTAAPSDASEPPGTAPPGADPLSLLASAPSLQSVPALPSFGGASAAAPSVGAPSPAGQPQGRTRVDSGVLIHYGSLEEALADLPRSQNSITSSQMGQLSIHSTGPQASAQQQQQPVSRRRRAANTTSEAGSAPPDRQLPAAAPESRGQVQRDAARGGPPPPQQQQQAGQQLAVQPDVQQLAGDMDVDRQPEGFAGTGTGTETGPEAQAASELSPSGCRRSARLAHRTTSPAPSSSAPALGSQPLGPSRHARKRGRTGAATAANGDGHGGGSSGEDGEEGGRGHGAGGRDQGGVGDVGAGGGDRGGHTGNDVGAAGPSAPQVPRNGDSGQQHLVGEPSRLNESAAGPSTSAGSHMQLQQGLTARRGVVSPSGAPPAEHAGAALEQQDSGRSGMAPPIRPLSPSALMGRLRAWRHGLQVGGPGQLIPYAVQPPPSLPTISTHPLGPSPPLDAAAAAAQAQGPGGVGHRAAAGGAGAGAGAQRQAAPTGGGLQETVSASSGFRQRRLGAIEEEEGPLHLTAEGMEAGGDPSGGSLYTGRAGGPPVGSGLCESDGTYLHCFSGHSNSMSIKECAWLGASCGHVVSGSDEGDLWVWDAGSSELLAVLPASADHMINSVQAHPFDPVLATCGTEHVVRLWSPCGDDPAHLTVTQQALVAANRAMIEHERRARQRSAQRPPLSWLSTSHITVLGAGGRSFGMAGVDERPVPGVDERPRWAGGYLGGMEERAAMGPGGLMAALLRQHALHSDEEEEEEEEEEGGAGGGGAGDPHGSDSDGPRHGGGQPQGRQWRHMGARSRGGASGGGTGEQHPGVQGRSTRRRRTQTPRRAARPGEEGTENASGEGGQNVRGGGGGGRGAGRQGGRGAVGDRRGSPEPDTRAFMLCPFM